MIGVRFMVLVWVIWVFSILCGEWGIGLWVWWFKILYRIMVVLFSYGMGWIVVRFGFII